MKIIINRLSILLILIATFSVAQAETKYNSKPFNSVGLMTAKNSQLMDQWVAAPLGTGGESSLFGHRLAVKGNWALVGAIGMGGNGMAHFYQYNGTNWVKNQSISPLPEDEIGQFGFAVSIDGNYAMIGAGKYRNTGQDFLGRVYVYEFDGTQWNEIQQLQPQAIQMGDRFSTAISISGNKAAIGANQFGNGENGYVVIYELVEGLWQETETIMSSAPSSSDFFGDSVSIENDRLLVGAPGDDTVTSGAGAAYIFDYIGGQWQQTSKLIPSASSLFAGFGGSVKLSGDMAFIGSFWDGETANHAGAAFVFENNNGSWTETSKILASDGSAGDRFGWSIDYNNGLLAVGASSGGANGGAAYLYKNINGLWTEIDQFEAPEVGIRGDNFGQSIALAGNQLVVGSSEHSVEDYIAGAVFVFEESSQIWTLDQSILADVGSAHDQFGRAVGIDGDWAMVGAHQDDDTEISSGAVYVYQKLGNIWQFHSKLLASDSDFYKQFGYSLDLTGNMAMIGAIGTGGSMYDSGVVYVFEYDGQNWNETDRLQPADYHNYNHFGSALSLQPNRVLIGAAQDNEQGNNAGAAYIFELEQGVWNEKYKLTLSSGSPGNQFGHSVDLDGDIAVVGAFGKYSYRDEAGAVAIFEFNGLAWNQTKMLMPTYLAYQDHDWFGYSVSLSGEQLLVGAPGDGDNFEGTGRVFNYQKIGENWIHTKLIEAVDSAPQDQFGLVVELIQNQAMVSAKKDGEQPHIGVTHLYDILDDHWVLNDQISTQINDYGLKGSSLSFSNNVLVIGSPGDNQNGTNSGSVSLYQFDRDLISFHNFE